MRLSITMQCGLSAGKQKLTVILVWWNSMQVTKGIWRMREQCVPGSLSSSSAQEPANKAGVYLAVLPYMYYKPELKRMFTEYVYLPHQCPQPHHCQN